VPAALIRTGAITAGNTGVANFVFPVLDHIAYRITTVNAVRGRGVISTVAQSQMLFGISHQTDLGVKDDEDDMLVGDNDMWYVGALADRQSLYDVLVPPIVVAGPQRLLAFNNTGATSALRVRLEFERIRVPNLTAWALLLTRTSFEEV